MLEIKASNSDLPVVLSPVVKFACARELLRLGAVLPEQALELAKVAEVTADQARRSFDRLDTLERSKPTVGQAARYGAVGAAGGAAIGAIGNAIEGGGPLRGATPKAKLLSLASNAVKGALGGGALPLVRDTLDRRAETGTLRRFMHENAGPQVKSAAETETQESGKPRLALGATAVAAPLAASVTAAEAAPRLVGSELLYHGTGPTAAKSVSAQGLDPTRGGSGASSWEHANPEFKSNSAGHVHLSKNRSNAELYARLNGAREVGEKMDETGLLSGQGPGKGVVLPISLPFDRVKSDFHLDPNGDMLDDLRSSKHVPASAIGTADESFLSRVWRGRPSSYLSYLKNNPKRVAAGVALGAATPALLYGGYRAGTSLLSRDSRANTGKLKSAGSTPTHRLVVEGTDEGIVNAGRILAKIHQLGSPGHSFGIKSSEDPDVDLGGWDGDGNTHLVNIKVEGIDGGDAHTVMQGGKMKVGGLMVEIMKRAGLLQRLPQAVKAVPAAAKSLVTGATPRMAHMNEVAGLGVLAVPGLDTLQSRARARIAGDRSEHGAERRQLLGEGSHAALDVAGLGMLAAPALSHLKHASAFTNSSYAGQPAQNGPGMRGRSQIPPFSAPELEVKTAKTGPLHRLGELVTGSRAGKLYDAALRHADSAAGGSQPHRKASQKLRLLARKEEGKVGRTQGALAASAALGAVSDTTGLAEKMRSKKEAGIGVGAGMSASQYSGPLSFGRFKMESQIPAFTSPSMTKQDSGGPAKVAASMNTATGNMSPAASLNTTQRVGAPKTTGFSGPSIADISKPKGFGTPIAGAQKNQL